MGKDTFSYQLADQQDKATYGLDQAIEAERSTTDLDTIAQQVTIEAELTKEQLVPGQRTERYRPRLLYVTTDVQFLEPDSQPRQFLLAVAQEFEELHLVVAAPQAHRKMLRTRINDTAWLYTTAQRYWWQLPRAITELVETELRFGKEFRPDFIVSDTPFAAALGVKRLAEKYDRPWQVHVTTPYWQRAEASALGHGWVRSLIARRVLRSCVSVRTSTVAIKEHLAKSFSIPDLSVLPQYNDLEAMLAQTTNVEPFSLPQYSYLILYVGSLGHESTAYRAIDAAREALQTTSVGMVIVGDGPAQAEFQKRAKILGIEKQVVFKPATEDLTPYLAGAQVLLVTDVDSKSDELVIKAAAAGTPLIMAKSHLREDLFTDGADAFLCSPTETDEFKQRLHEMMNDHVKAEQFAERSQYMVRARLHEDPEQYRLAYAATLMKAVSVTESLDNQ